MQTIWKANGGGISAGRETNAILVYGLRDQIDF